MLTLIRHGQAGSRLVYDALSGKGAEQSRALGQWLRVNGFRFDGMITGGLERQKLTALEIMSGIGGPAPPFSIDTRWSEFDLDRVCRELAPQLALVDPDFRREYEQLVRDIADPDSFAHRSWRNCDVTVVRAWIDGRCEYEGESFAAFSERVRDAMAAIPKDQNIAVVTSATPIAVCVGSALDLAPGRVMQLAGALRNASFTEITSRADGIRLLSFNNIPHLTDPQLLTYR